MIKGFRSDINESLNVSRRTLSRYITELNNCGLFDSPIEYNPIFKEYDLKSYINDSDYDLYDDSIEPTIYFKSSDSVIESHLKRLAIVFSKYCLSHFCLFNDSYWDDEDIKDFSAPIVLKMFREEYPELKVSVRTIERDIKLISGVYSYYLTEGPGMF